MRPSLEIVSMTEAISRGLTRYYTGKPCKRGHITERYCRDRCCVECKSDKYKDYFLNNRKKENSRSLGYRKKNEGRFKENYSSWIARNYHRKLAINAARRSRKISATPSWLTEEHLAEISAIYARATALSEETGEKHHVDHIVPLNGKTVSGLHVPWNLQVIPASENLRKSNRHHDRT